jgi:hypothetical protein
LAFGQWRQLRGLATLPIFKWQKLTGRPADFGIRSGEGEAVLFVCREMGFPRIGFVTKPSAARGSLMEMLQIGGFRCNFRGTRKGNSLPNDFEKFRRITQKKLAPPVGGC